MWPMCVLQQYGEGAQGCQSSAAMQYKWVCSAVNAIFSAAVHVHYYYFFYSAADDTCNAAVQLGV